MVKVDLNLKRAVLDMMMGGDKLSYCFQCGKCNDVCPVSQRWGSRYNPRDIVLFSALGFKEALVTAVVRDPFILWGCTTCETCDESCPAEIPITDIISLLKNVSVSLGVSPEFYPSSTRAVLDCGMAIPVQPAVEKRRVGLGIGPAPHVPAEEIRKLMLATGVDKLVQKQEETA
ncbi:MAG: 4Fe-4S dicluster domain-containing protein [Promethearchaeota archaeon]